MKKLVSLLMVMVMLLSFGSGAFAEAVSNRSNGNRYEIKMIDGTVLTQEEFIQYLYDNKDKIIEIKVDKNNGRFIMEQYNHRQFDTVINSAGVLELFEGTWNIPGIGLIAITAYGVITIGGEVIKAGTWLYNKIVDYFESKAIEESDERIEEVLKNKTKVRDTKGDTEIHEGDGGYSQAEKDFKKLNKGKISAKSNGTKVGQLPDGRTINVRKDSSDGRATLEIEKTRRKTIKIRYK